MTIHLTTSPAIRSWAYGPHGHLRAGWRVGAFASVYFLLQGIIAAVAEPLETFATARSTSVVTLQEFTITLAMLLAVVVVLRFVDQQPLSKVGLDAAAWRVPTISQGVCVGALAIGATCALLFALGDLAFASGAPVAAITNSNSLSATTAWLRSALSISALLVPAALFEELVFRGYLWRVAEDSWNSGTALVVTSVLFGLSHYQNPGANALNIFNVMLAGVCLGLVRYATGSLIAAWAAHFVWNWVMAAGLHVQVSGLSLSMPNYHAVIIGPDWVSGGNWGPEGGAIATVVLLALAAWGVRRSSFQEQFSTFNHDRLMRSGNGAH